MFPRVQRGFPGESRTDRPLPVTISHVHHETGRIHDESVNSLGIQVASHTFSEGTTGPSKNPHKSVSNHLRFGTTGSLGTER